MNLTSASRPLWPPTGHLLALIASQPTHLLTLTLVPWKRGGGAARDPASSAFGLGLCQALQGWGTHYLSSPAPPCQAALSRGPSTQGEVSFLRTPQHTRTHAQVKFWLPGPDPLLQDGSRVKCPSCTHTVCPLRNHKPPCGSTQAPHTYPGHQQTSSAPQSGCLGHQPGCGSPESNLGEIG